MTSYHGHCWRCLPRSLCNAWGSASALATQIAAEQVKAPRITD
ncbi:hypothetical protein PROFUN_13275 [Planoprotostelium fungivorum]|uniref:Uncharacterized protein n=1 Tax=Planoprotostelium fungivorum TaxID=1890364 RepID=A0A2P6N4U3_9EUKA|nr:hypothetical protein PROFUN_13275 [Planoprotostelium fungivorum]